MSARPLLLLAAAALAVAGCALPGPEKSAGVGATVSGSAAAPAVYVTRGADGGLQIEFSSDAAFDFGTARLLPAFEPQLVYVAALVMQSGQAPVSVIGHTDNVGAADFNQTLSERRAQRVAAFLVGLGVAPERLVTAGRGALQPRATNATAAGRQSNRRIQLLVSPGGPEAAP